MSMSNGRARAFGSRWSQVAAVCTIAAAASIAPITPGIAAAATTGQSDVSVEAGVFPMGEALVVGQTIGQLGLLVANAGPDVATDVVATITLPDALEVASWPAVADLGGTCVSAAHTATCTWTELPVGSSVVLGSVRAIAPGSGMSVIAEVSSSSVDPDLSRNTFFALGIDAVDANADIAVFAAALSPDLRLGVPTQGYLAASNWGPGVATDVVAEAVFPPNLRLDGIDRVEMANPSDPEPECTVTGQTLRCTSATLAPVAQFGATYFVFVDVTPIDVGTGAITGSIASPVLDPIPGDHTSSSTITVIRNEAQLVASLARNFTEGPISELAVIQLEARVRNDGPQAASDTRLLVDVPPAFRVLGAFNSSCAVSSSSIECAFGSLDPGQSQVVFFLLEAIAPADPATVTATATSSTPDTSPSDDTTTVSIPVVEGRADLSIDVAGPSTVVAGEQRRFDVIVSSLGPDSARDVVVDIDPPAGARLVSVFGTASDCTLVGGGARCVISRFSTFYSIGLSAVADGSTPTMSLAARVSSPTSDPNPSANSDSLTSNVLPAFTADLSLRAVFLTVGDFVVGNPVRVQAEVQQNGPAQDAPDSTVTFTVPADFVPNAALALSGGWTCDIAGQVVTCRNARFSRPFAGQFELTLTPVRSGAGGSITVEARAAGPDPLPFNNVAVLPARTIVAPVDLAVAVAAPSSVSLGAEIPVDVTLSNTPLSLDPFSAVATIDFPAALRPVRIDSPDACLIDGQRVTCGPVPVPSGSSRTIRVVAMAVQQTAGADVVASVDSFTVEPNLSNNSASARVAVGAPQLPMQVFVSVAEPRDASVAVFWSDTPDAATITDYLVQYSSDGGRTWKAFADGVAPSLFALVTGLRNGTAYTFRVAAVNVAGQGPWSVPTTPVIPLPKPRAPTNLEVSLRRGVVSLRWRAPAPAGRLPVIDYVVEYSRNGGAWTVVDDGFSTATSASLSGLPAGRYRFRVAATSTGGQGAYSSASDQITIR